MTRRTATLRLLAALILAATAAFLLLLARDVWHFERAMHDADARAQLGPIGVDAWSANTVLPGGFVRAVLGINEDLAYRRAVMGAADLFHFGGTSNQHVLVETALERVVLSDPHTVQASAAADYLGVVLFDDRSTPQQAISVYVNPKSLQPNQSQTPEQKALAQFETAVSLDPENANAKKNLETMLAQVKPPNEKATPRPGNGSKVGSHGSGQRPPGYGF